MGFILMMRSKCLQKGICLILLLSSFSPKCAHLCVAAGAYGWHRGSIGLFFFCHARLDQFLVRSHFLLLHFFRKRPRHHLHAHRTIGMTAGRLYSYQINRIRSEYGHWAQNIIIWQCRYIALLSSCARSSTYRVIWARMSCRVSWPVSAKCVHVYAMWRWYPPDCGEIYRALVSGGRAGFNDWARSIPTYLAGINRSEQQQTQRIIKKKLYFLSVDYFWAIEQQCWQRQQWPRFGSEDEQENM